MEQIDFDGIDRQLVFAVPIATAQGEGSRGGECLWAHGGGRGAKEAAKMLYHCDGHNSLQALTGTRGAFPLKRKRSSTTRACLPSGLCLTVVSPRVCTSELNSHRDGVACCANRRGAAVTGQLPLVPVHTLCALHCCSVRSLLSHLAWSDLKSSAAGVSACALSLAANVLATSARYVRVKWPQRRLRVQHRRPRTSWRAPLNARDVQNRWTLAVSCV
eukprot:6200136-Pleurochrysis_carterae.AAC.2